MSQFNVKKQAASATIVPPTGYVGLYYDSGVGAWLYMDEAGVTHSFDSTVTTVSVVSANGLSGSVATPTTTPAITLSTSLNTPILAGNGTALIAATTTGSGST